MNDRGGRVTSVTVTPVAVPDPPLLNAFGVHEPMAPRTVLQVHTAAGVVGLGETYGSAAVLDTVRRTAADVVGLDVFDLPGLTARVAGVGADAPLEAAAGLTGAGSLDKSRRTLLAAFEVAFLDAQGRLLGIPVTDLLGGAVRQSVPFSAYLFYKWERHPGSEPDAWGPALDPEGIVRQARAMVERHGFTTFKLKAGVFRPEEEVAAIEALRAAFPAAGLRIDPNTAWTVPTSVAVAERLGDVLEYLEDPTPGLPGMAEVAERSPLPLATNMCVVGFADVPAAVRQGSVQVVLGDHHYWGGMRASQELAAVTRTFGLGLSMHSNTHFGISLAAMLQLAAATPHLTYSCDSHWPWSEDDIVVPGVLRIADGAAPVPSGPGLGVELDPDALARAAHRFASSPVRTRDDTAYMRTVEPDFTPHVARW